MRRAPLKTTLMATVAYRALTIQTVGFHLVLQ